MGIEVTFIIHKLHAKLIITGYFVHLNQNWPAKRKKEQIKFNSLDFHKLLQNHNNDLIKLII
jgi:hypothetical protein